MHQEAYDSDEDLRRRSRDNEEISYYELQPEDGGQCLRLKSENGILRLGRCEDRDVIWKVAYISRNHATLICEHGKLFVVRETRNDHTILVNGSQIKKDARHQLQLGDSINFFALKNKDEQKRQNYLYTVRGSVLLSDQLLPEVIQSSSPKSDRAILLKDDDELEKTSRNKRSRDTEPMQSQTSDSFQTTDQPEDDTGPSKKKLCLLERPRSLPDLAKSTTEQSVEAVDIMDDLECAICQGIIAHCHILACGHSGCGSCLLEWLRLGKGCPVCRENIKPGALLIPVLRIDTMVDKYKHHLTKDDLDDFEQRSSQWRSLHPKDASGPVTAPRNLPVAQPPAPPQPLFPGRGPLRHLQQLRADAGLAPTPFANGSHQLSSARPPRHRTAGRRPVRDIRFHFGRPPMALLRPPPPQPRSIINLADDDDRGRDVIDLSL